MRLYSCEAEMAVIGGCVLDNRLIRKVRGIVSTEDFYRPVHRAMFSAVCRLSDKGFPVDWVTLRKDDPELDHLYLIELTESTPAASATPRYAEIVREFAERRNLRSLGEWMREAAGDTDQETSSILSEARNKVRQVRGPQLSIDIAESPDEYEVEQGIPTGLPSLDRAIEGAGLVRGQMTVVAARKKDGKTALMLQVCRHAMDKGYRVLYVTLADLNRRQVYSRLYRQATGWGAPPDDLFKRDDWLRQVKALKEGWELRTMESKECGDDVEKVCRAAECVVDEFPRHIVCFDYAQKFRAKGESRVSQMEAVSSRLAKFADETGTVVIVGSQLTKEGQARYSQEFEDDCGLFIRITRTNPDDLDDDRREIEIPYNRFGPAGSFTALWSKDRGTLQEAL